MKLKIKNNTLGIILTITAAILVLFVSFYFSPKPPTITSTQPQKNQQYIIDTSDIIINFDRIISKEDRRLLNISITPAVKGETVFVKNTLIFKPNLLSKNQQYQIKVMYKKDIIYDFSFKTNLYSTEEIKLQGQQQIEDDYLFNKKFEQAVKEYPWYPQLPIKTSEYTIYYDFDLELFRIRILTPSLEAQDLEAVTEKALKELIEIGVPKPIKHEIISN